MRKRKRKKLHIEDFTEWGFGVKLDVTFDEKDQDANMKFIDELIDFVEANDMYMGGSPVDFYVCRNGSATEEDRMKTLDFLTNHEKVTRVKIEPLTNSWYGGKEKATRYDYKLKKKKLWEDF